jgi:hypothetical protein
MYEKGGKIKSLTPGEVPEVKKKIEKWNKNRFLSQTKKMNKTRHKKVLNIERLRLLETAENIKWLILSKV